MSRSQHLRSLVAAGAVVALGAAGVVLPALPASATTIVDLTSGSSPIGVSGAFVQFSEFPSSTGTGVFESFVRIQAGGTERGFNSDTPNFDDLSSSNFTRDLPLDAVPVLVNPLGAPAGSYREFRLDINQKSSSALLTLETAKLWISSEQNVQPGRFVNATKDFNPALANSTLLWDLDSGDPDTRILLDYNRAPGSGNGDMVLLIPDTGFSCGGSDCYVTLYSEFGGEYDTSGVATERDGSTSNDGFEEWSVRKNITEPTATKTLDLSFDRDITWDLTKSVDVDDWNFFEGDSGTSKYTVTLDKTVTDSNFEASGVVNLLNAGNDQIKVETISDSLNPGGAAGITDCVVDDVIDGTSPSVGTPPFTGQEGVVEAGETMQCTYFKDLGDSQTIGTEYANTVTFYEKVAGQNVAIASAEAVSTLSNDNATVTGAESVDVTDTVEGDLGTFSDDATPMYTTEFTCDDEGDNPNTATAYAAGTTDEVASDDETVTVTCYEPTVVKTAETEFTRTYTWDVDKKVKQAGPFPSDYTPQYPNYVDDIPSGGGDPLLMNDGQVLSLMYGVDVTYTSDDDDYSVEGDITITNPNPDRELELTDVSDLIEGYGAAGVDCGDGFTFPYNLAKAGDTGDELTCTYGPETLPDDTERKNTATATIQNYAFSAAEPAGTKDGTSDFDGEADVDFSGATIIEVDPCVDVYDDKTTGTDVPLGTVCAPQLTGGDSRPGEAVIADNTAGEYEFEYSLDIGKVADATTVDILLECGENSFTNTASVYLLGESAANEDTPVAQDSASVAVTVACEEGCTLTQGYWKTHSDYGPVPLKKSDPTWDLLPGGDGPDTMFFNSGKTWYDVFWTSPGQAKKNGFKSQEYVILAHQYMAATLNNLAGASLSSVQDTYDNATAYFEAGGTGANKQTVIGWAGTLGSYNEGDIGPGHCDQ